MFRTVGAEEVRIFSGIELQLVGREDNLKVELHVDDAGEGICAGTVVPATV